MLAGGARSKHTTGGRGNSRLRTLDRTVARSLLQVVGAFKRRRPLPPSLRRIGLMKSTGIGDMILTTAIIRDVMVAHPDAEVVVFAGADNADVARLVPGVRTAQLATARPWAVIPRLRAERLDAIVDFGQWSRLEALYAALSGAAWKAGFDTPGQRRHYAYDATVPHSASVSEISNYRELISTLGVTSTSVPSFRPAKPTRPLPVDGPFVVFHLWPGGFRSELREWPAESWRSLADRLTKSGFSIVLTGGAADVERTAEFVESSGDLASNLKSVAGEYRLNEIVDLIAAASCVVSVNTGLMHLAAAAGAPTVGLNGPTSARRWGPIGPKAVCVDSDLPGCGYLNLGFEYDGRRTDCMRGISVDRVASATLELANA
jgi:ADP-heptose:LPS heptosyltransferase